MTSHSNDDHDDFGGLARDLPGLLSRRSVLALLTGASLAALAACGSDDDTTSATARVCARYHGGGDVDEHRSNHGHDGRGDHDCGGGYHRCRGDDRGRRLGRLRDHSQRDGRTVPGRRLQRTGRAQRERRRAQRHHVQHRFGVRSRGRRAADDHPHARRHRERLLRVRRRRGVRLALRPGGALLDVLRWGHRPELPPRRAGSRRQRSGHVHEHLPGGVLGTVAAHPLRGVPERRRRRPPRKGCLPRPRSPFRRTPAMPCTPPTGYEQSVRNLAQTSLTRTTCSATTVAFVNSRRSPAMSPAASASN